MNPHDYIKELKKYLAALDKDKRDDIIKEIESYILESEATYSLLVERFGEPKDLASEYLEGLEVEQKESSSIYKKTKRTFLGIFIFLVIIFIVIGSIIYFMTRDDFNYEKFTSTSVTQKLESPWLEIKSISKLDIVQSKVVIYWNDEKKTKISCKKDDEKNENYKAENKTALKGDTLFIKQSSCFLSLPKQEVKIKTYQSKAIIIKPSSSINFDTEQSKIEFAKKAGKYQFKLDKKESEIDESFLSNSEGILISGKIYQSSVVPYSY